MKSGAHALMARQFRLLLVFICLLPTVAIAQKIDSDGIFAPDKLIEVEIRMKEADWDSLRFQSRNIGTMMSGGMVDDPFTYFQTDLAIDGIEIESVGVRKKGLFGSADSERPSLKISFDEFKKQDPVDGLNRLTLNNNKQDSSQLSQFLSYQLFRKAGIHAPRSNFARVTVNGQDLGIYSHVESIDKPFLKKSFGDNSGNLYEGTLTDFHPKTIDKIEIKTNNKENDRSELKRLTEILAADGTLDVSTLKEVIDLDYFLRYWAMEGILRFWDGYASNQNNFFLYAHPENQRGYFIPWGADGSFSKDGGPFGMMNGGRGPTSFYAHSILCNRLYHTDGIPELYKATSIKLLDDVWIEGELLEEIDRAEKLVTPYLHRSQRATPKAIEDLREFIRGRRDVVLKELEGSPFQVDPEPRKPMYQVSVGQVSGTFATAWQDRTNNGRPEASNAELNLQIGGANVAVKDLTATVTEFRMPQFGSPNNGRNTPDTSSPVSLTITGKNVEDGEVFSVMLSIASDSWERAVTQRVPVFGIMTEGRQSGFGFGGPQGKSLNGELWLSSAGNTAGEQVAGQFDLKIVEVHGGFFNR